MSRKYKILITILLLGILLVVFLLTMFFSGKNGVESNQDSLALTKMIQQTLSKNFTVNHKDIFWKVTLNQILRKAAHFVEYLLIGSVLCALLNVYIHKPLVAGAISVVICPVLAYFDEFRQKFITGRTPSWFDVWIDFYGALLGIIIITIVFSIIKRINNYKKQITDLQNELDVIKLRQ